MKREEFAAQCERGAAQAPGLPVTAALLRWTAEQLKRSEPPWWKKIAAAWDKRPFVAWSEAWSLYVTALHFEALSDAECPLVPFFPSCGGTAEAEPATGLARFLAAPPPTFFENLRLRHRRTYVAARAQLWIDPAVLFFQRKRGLPFYIVETNSGAGLNMTVDAVARIKGFDSDMISARIGLDPDPLDLADLGQRRWLTAGVWPDYLQGIVDLDAAVDAVQKRTAKENAFLQLAPCAPEKAPAFIAKNVPADDEDVGLLALNMGTTSRMTDADYAAFSAAMFATLKSWGDRGLWLEAEHVRGETYSTTLQLRAHRVRGGTPVSAVLASVDFDTGTHAYDAAAAADFLSVP
jgi:hypothetical protein